MRIVEIKGTYMDLTPAIKARVDKALQKSARLLEGVEPADVRVDVGKTSKHHNKGAIFRAEFNLTLPGKMIRAEETREDLYEAIDTASKDLLRQIKKYKDKKTA